MRLVLCPTLHEHEREVTLLERLMHGTTDGALMILPEESSDELEALLNHGYRFVVIDPMMPLNERIPLSLPPTPQRRPGDEASAVTRTHAHRCDHRPARHEGDRGPRRGYYAALAAAGIMPDPVLEVEGNFELPGGISAAEQLLDLPEPPTAIFSFNDNMAIGAMQTAARAAFASRKISRSSASTISTKPRS